jgi:transposase
MNAKIQVSSKLEHRAVIRYLNAEGHNGNEIYAKLCAMYGQEAVMSRQAVYKWINMFTKVRTSIEDEERAGRPSDSVNDETVAILRALLQKDRRLTITDIHQQIATEYPYVTVSRASIHTILTRSSNAPGF